MEAVKKLVVEEFTTPEGGKTVSYEGGYKYSYFKDPETGKYYRPTNGFQVTVSEGGDLRDRFVEVEADTE